jgi:hypothetical protein
LRESTDLVECPPLRIGKVAAGAAWATTALIAYTVAALAVVSVLPGR